MLVSAPQQQPPAFVLTARYLLDNCRPDLDFIVKMIDKNALVRLQAVASAPFKRCSYTEAIEILQKAVEGGKKFEHSVRTVGAVRSSWETSLVDCQYFCLSMISYRAPVP